MDTGSAFYKKAFEEYLRKGCSVDLILKQARTTTHYIWRTRQDGKVRPSHAANNGRMFAWDTPPATGHPGEDYGCRCRAEAYAPGVTEFMDISLSNVNDTGRAWTSADFVRHYWTGNGKAVTLREIGHLVKIVEAYMNEVEQRLKGQVADAARNAAGRSFYYTFGQSYAMRDVVFSVGNTTIGGAFTGSSKPKHGALEIVGTFRFHLQDKFTDLLGLHVDLPASTPYDIYDDWGGSLRALVQTDRTKSRFRFDQ